MMDFDYRAKRLENEQKKMKEAAKKKLQLEKLQQEKQQEREKELAEYKVKQEELKEQLRLEKEMIELHENQLTNGIHFSKQFVNFYEIETNENEIGDKITLSEDCLVELTNLDVFQKSSAVNFQLEITYKTNTSPTAPVRRMITYCGINEFTAPKETIGLSPKIVDTIRHHSSSSDAESEEQYYNPFTPPFPTPSTTSTATTNNLKPASSTPSPSGNILSKSNNVQIVSINLRYLKLPKCTYIKFKPKFHDFYHIEAVKRCLEENLSYHTSITLNDLLLIKYRGEEFPLLVTDIKPERYGSLLNTDVEVDFDYSEEYERKKAEEEQQKQKAVGNKHVAPASAVTSTLTTSVGHKLGGGEVTSSAEPMDVDSPVNEELLALLSSKQVKDEPLITADNKSNYLQAKFKLMNGKSLMRKFLYDETLLDIFAYVVKELQNQNSLKDHEIALLQLSISNPTKAFLISDLPSLSKSLNELELNVKNQLFFVSLH